MARINGDSRGEVCVIHRNILIKRVRVEIIQKVRLNERVMCTV